MFGRGNIRGPVSHLVEPAISYDADALAYVSAIQVTEGVSMSYAHRLAINNLVKRMKGQDSGYANFGSTAIWDARILFCPNLGNSLATTKYNLFNPVASDAALRQLYNGGVTYDTGYGVKGNGTNGYIRTFVRQRDYATMSQSSGTIGAVYKSDQTSGRIDWGCYGTGTSYDANMWLRIITGGSVNTLVRGYTYDVGPGTGGPATQKGHWMVRQKSGVSNIPQIYYNKTKIYEYGGSPSYSYLDESREYTASGLNGELVFLALNYNMGTITNYTSNTLILYYIMADLGAQVDAWNEIIEQFCTDTGRKTW